MIKTPFILTNPRNLKVHLVESTIFDHENVNLVYLYLHIQELESPLKEKQNIAMFKMF